MATISHIIQKIIEHRPMLQEAIHYGIVNYANLAEHLKKEIGAELGEVNTPAIIMALRRYGEKIQKKQEALPFQFNSEITLKTGLCDITIVKTPSALGKLRKIYDLIEHEKGETLNAIHGDYEITLIISQKKAKKAIALLKGENIKNQEQDVVALTMSFSKDFLYTPGSIARATRKLAWENINVLENISTMTELIFIVSKKDATRAFNALQELTEESA